MKSSPITRSAHMEDCTVEGCSNPIKTKSLGLCSKHYMRVYRHGDVSAFRPNALSDTDRFMALVEKDGDCWMWTGTITNAGYGRFWLRGKNVSAHRASIVLFGEGIELGQCALHKCDTRKCVNPDHLYVGTHKENMRDRQVRGRAGKKLTGEVAKAIRLDGRSYRKIAADYGIGSTTVQSIKEGKIWKYV